MKPERESRCKIVATLGGQAENVNDLVTVEKDE